MTVIGFHFTKMVAEKKKSTVGKINVSNNIILTSVKEAKINMGSSKQKGIEFSFEYTSKYEPEIASINLQGAVVFIGSDAKVKETLKKWEKDKVLLPDVLEEVYNNLLSKCHVQALILGRDMQLPPHLPMPKVTTAEKKD